MLLYADKIWVMNALNLGNTRLVVTRLGLGLAAIGRPGYINLGHAEDLNHNYNQDVMESRAHAVLDAAWEAGIRYFDAARSYGLAEAFLGSWLVSRLISPGQVVVGSKWGYTYTANWRVDAPVNEIKEHSLAVLRRQKQESQAALDGYLGLYQVHSATLDSGVLENGEVLAELGRLREGGLAIGLTVSGSGQAATLERAMRVVVDGRSLFQCVQATWNLLEPSAGEILQAVHQSGMGVIVKEALANGRLTGKNADPEFAPNLNRLAQAAAQQGATPEALALAAALAQPWADVVLSGAATPDQLRSNVAALDLTWDDDLAGNLDFLAEPTEVYWSKRSRLPWN
jgi:aryl-alcohol dehydrogenase-like predicted oxidoreductase